VVATPPTTAPKLDASEKESVRKALSDLEAAEARVERNAQRIYDETKSKLITELLPVLDNLDRTIHAATLSSDEALITGLTMVRSQLEGVLLRYGASRIDAVGERFDPSIHEAIATVDVNDPNLRSVVLEQAEAGYRFGGRVLRAAKVKVGAYTPTTHAKGAADQRPMGPIGRAPPALKP
jgi:molecular chaperone GrpE